MSETQLRVMRVESLRCQLRIVHEYSSFHRDSMILVDLDAIQSESLY